MRHALFGAAVTLAIGCGLWMGASKNALNEVTAAILVLGAAVCLAGVAVVDAVRGISE